MILKLKTSLSLIILSILFFSCQKEYSLEGNLAGGTAVFSFNGSPGACTNAVVGGTFQAGAALGPANIVTVSVNVGTTGTYTVATATVNGISFTGSGIFTATGPQTITLTGRGIPAAPGTFSFTPGASGCAFPVTISSGGGSSGGTAKYSLNGAPGNCTGFTLGGAYAAGTALGAGNTASVGVTVTTVGTYIITTNTVNGIAFAASGTFTATGSQVVQLTGSGTPLAGGVFDYTPGANGCTFSITVTGAGSGSAVFTYSGAPGSCTSAIAAGSYATGTALTALNTVIVSVNVTTIGAYSISTPLVNGFSFSGSGSFATTGAQSVTLTGTGTPVVAGVFNFTPSNNGCSFPVTVVAGANPTDFLKCTIDGVATNFNVNLLGTKISIDTFDIIGFETSASITQTFQIELKKSPAITAGTYSRYLATNTATFCAAAYFDTVAATPWLTGLSPLTTGFTVTVTSYTANRISGDFSGTIYGNPLLGTSPKVITAGSFSMPY